MSKILIAYGTRFGATEKTAIVLKEELVERGYEVDVHNIKRGQIADLSGHDAVIVGSGVTMGRTMGNVDRFLKEIPPSIDVALFISAGGTKGEAEDDPSKLQEAVDRWITPWEEKHDLDPFSRRVFGGWIRILGFEIMNTWDRTDAEAWAEEIDDILRQR